ncbi:putative cysteine synthase [Filobasidium floriforme]|uniref:putative cysteine synthase n=1 Tax=Filobasidium floriforme TaxID=5210 RepID=UPI001E8D3CB0|nr:putative cysteine synthase [Filobasidium floriforme]KAH8088155.1 putative cysteine synthase [Filobasidium floriforme]
MSGIQVEKTLLWITAATVVVGLSAWAERKLRAQTFRPEQVDKQETGSGKVVHGVIGLIGNTPLVRIDSLSDALGVEILGKAEFLNPGGSVKDRVALQIIEDAERAGLLVPNTGSRIFEGTVGSTGISIATVARAKGYETTIIMPDDVALEKVQLAEMLGATVERVRPASIVDEKQFVNLARARAAAFTGDDSVVHSHARNDGQTDVLVSEKRESSTAVKQSSARGFFADQFENESNFRAHFEGTGPEIWEQTGGKIDAFVSGAGTGGTLSGTSTYLRRRNPQLKVILSDPEGSGLFNKIKYGVMYDVKEREGRKRRHQVDTIVEGIGINRLTRNFDIGRKLIDDAYRVTDQEAISMSRHLVMHDGLFLGSSSACNLVASVKLAKTLPKGSTIVTILCDSGSRHQSKFWSKEYIDKAGFKDSPDITSILG